MKYSEEQKERILKEVEESTNIAAVAKKHNMPDSTIHTWLAKRRKDQPKSEAQSELKIAKKEIADLKLKNMILEDLLKKTHNLWAND
ncbi:MAG: transposase [Halobacteriovoraceae bacterium]|nr:transposase [Halobacteriovoraceae bacterium]MCB9063465.1 transposase [Halobacteriovoraceae bacterium]